jgi:hypothetical protein
VPQREFFGRVETNFFTFRPILLTRNLLDDKKEESSKTQVIDVSKSDKAR